MLTTALTSNEINKQVRDHEVWVKFKEMIWNADIATSA